MIRERRETRQSRWSQSNVGNTCLNCGEAVVGRYCHNCGQHTADHNHSLWEFILEYFEEFVRLDSKFVRTIVPLIVKPGLLTKEWVAGRRVRYITPLKLYISLSAICFLLISLTSHPNVIQVNSDNRDQSLDSSRQALDKELAASRSPVKRAFVGQMEKLMLPGPEGDRIRTDFSERFVGRLSTANLILLPIFALLFKMLYIRRSRFYVEHLVFALHYYAFFALGTTVILLASKLTIEDWIVFPTVLWMMVYLPVAMFVNYQQGIIKTIIKCWIFCSVYVVAIGCVLLGMLVLVAYETPATLPKATLSAGVKQPLVTKHPAKPLSH